MIEVILTDLTGVLACAEADDPESALIAARALWDDMAGIPHYGDLSLAFVVNGAVIRRGITLPAISSAFLVIA